MDKRKLNLGNIDLVISEYVKGLEEIPLHIEAENFIDFMNLIKRKKLSYGPYPHVTLFEASNRIMTDLVILFGVKKLLNNEINEIRFDEYTVEYGNEDKNEHDITAEKSGIKLKCEAFNVSSSFFQGKKSMMLKKLRANKKDNEILLLLFNDDALNENQKLKLEENEFYLPVKVEL